jgi:hypothetical protein
MKSIITYLILTVFFVINFPNKSFSQEELVFHYAYIADHESKILYISNLATVVFMEYFDYENDEYLPEEIERQFFEFVEFKYELIIPDNADFSYKMGEDDIAVEESWIGVINAYKDKAYKVKKVKNFVYD